MQTLSPEKAKALALQLSHDMHPDSQREFFLIHSEKVVEI
jgi:hypothetical protein